MKETRDKFAVKFEMRDSMLFLIVKSY